jgi:hypothetical protein
MSEQQKDWWNEIRWKGSPNKITGKGLLGENSVYYLQDCVSSYYNQFIFLASCHLRLTRESTFDVRTPIGQNSIYSLQ